MISAISYARCLGLHFGFNSRRAAASGCTFTQRRATARETARERALWQCRALLSVERGGLHSSRRLERSPLIGITGIQLAAVEALAKHNKLKVILDARTLAVVKMTFGVSLVAANDVIERALPALQQQQLLC